MSNQKLLLAALRLIVFSYLTGVAAKHESPLFGVFCLLIIIWGLWEDFANA